MRYKGQPFLLISSNGNLWNQLFGHVLPVTCMNGDKIVKIGWLYNFHLAVRLGHILQCLRSDIMNFFFYCILGNICTVHLSFFQLDIYDDIL